MLNAIVRFSLRFRDIVIALAVMALVYGAYALKQAKYDVFPEFAAAQVGVQTEAPGLSPEQVEVLVTRPIESELNGVAGLQAIRSQSVQGLSVVSLTFDGSRDINLDRQAVTERLSALNNQLPQGVGTPVMEPLTSATGDLMVLGLSSEKLSPMALRSLVETVVKPRLLAVPGVAKVSLWGGEIRQMQIQIEPKKLVLYDLSVDDIFATAQRLSGVRGGGFIDTDQKRITIKVEGQSLTASDLAHTALVRTGGSQDISVLMGDVAKVTENAAPAVGDGAVMGKPGVVMNLWAQFGANTLETTALIQKTLDQLKPSLNQQGVNIHADLFRAANFVNTAVHNLSHSLLLGAVLVIGVLFIFLMDVRTSFISCIAIPLSLLAAIALLQRIGYTLNTMTLGGLAIAIGEVVDDAVIDVENILRRLRENQQRPVPESLFRVVLMASIEVRHAVVYATAAVCLVFLPVFAMSGLAGRLFGPLGLAYVLSILFSLAVAVTLTPALCLVLLGRRSLSAHEPRLATWLKERYRAFLEFIERFSTGVLVLVALFTAGTLALLPFLQSQFLPEFREGHFIVHMTAPSGTSLKESIHLGSQVTQALLYLPFVRTVAQRAGRASVDDTYGTNASEFEVDLKPVSTAQAEHAADDIHKALKPFKDIDFEVNTFLAERIDETLSGYTSSVVVNIFGQDLDVLDQKAAEMQKLLTGISGVSDPRVQSPPGAPEISVRLRPEALRQWGLDPVSVLDGINTAYQGKVTGQIYDGIQVFDVAVILNSAQRNNPAQVGELRFRNPAGTYVPLRSLAEIQVGNGRSAVLHQAAQRVQTVTCNVQGRGEASFIDELKKKTAEKISLPAGTFVEFAGASAAQSQASHDLLLYSAMTIVGIILLLFGLFGSWRNCVLVLINLPMALTGGILAIAITRTPVSVGCLVGFVTLFGITLRNSLMMVSHFEHLVTVEGESWGLHAALRGASERLIPVMMTALVTALGLLPLALGSGAAGREIEGPMAVVILGGLMTSTALNLIVLPTLALRFARFSKHVEEDEMKEGESNEK